MSRGRAWKSPKEGAYASWRAMRSRCINPKDAAYAYYGGRGIGICDEWVDNFDQFYADMGERPNGLTLDRIDSELGYSKGNCRWATRKVQQNNVRRNIVVTHAGKTQTLSQWADDLGVPYYTLWNRISCHGLTPERALTKEKLVQPWRHGTSTGYTKGCRCDACRAARTNYSREYRRKLNHGART